jgi:hypothetical protein
MYPHRMRLRGPWECEPLARVVKQRDGRLEMVSESLPPRRIIMPRRWADAGLADFAGRVRFRRRFGMPRRLDAHEVVWLTFAEVEGIAVVTLNGHFLGRHEQPAQPFEFEVTGLLREGNELVVDIEAPAGNGYLGEVALEVRCSAFLRRVRAWPESTSAGVTLRIQGEAVGTCDQPLELYVLLDSSTIAYRTIQPTALGQSFDIVSDEIVADTWNRLKGQDREVRVDLVNGAVIWYTTLCVLRSP